MVKPSSLETTNTLKGVAIAAVVINHYLNLNISEDFTGYANLWVSIFFFLSGYGLYFSLNKLQQNSKLNLLSKEILFFYCQRAFRIFPVLWIVYLIELNVYSSSFDFWGLLGIGVHKWFIPALLWCYIFAPLIFTGIQRSPVIFALALLFGFVLMNFVFMENYLPNGIERWVKFIIPKWRGVYFLYIIIFSFGFFIHLFPIKPYKGILYKLSQKVFWLLVLTIIIIMVIIKIYFSPSHFAEFFLARFVINLTQLGLLVLLCIFSLKILVHNSFLSFFGKRSYSIYLLNTPFFYVMEKLTNHSINFTSEFLWLCVCFPFFIAICVFIEWLGNILNRKLRKLLLVVYVNPKTSEVISP